jgi:hypothetical protein
LIVKLVLLAAAPKHTNASAVLSLYSKRAIRALFSPTSCTLAVLSTATFDSVATVALDGTCNGIIVSYKNTKKATADIRANICSGFIFVGIRLGRYEAENQLEKRQSEYHKQMKP